MDRGGARRRGRVDRQAPPLAGDAEADVAIVGGGYTGLWTALALKERDPDLRVVLLEAGVCGTGPSGRNGGFVHGYWSYLPRMRELLRRRGRAGRRARGGGDRSRDPRLLRAARRGRLAARGRDDPRLDDAEPGRDDGRRGRGRARARRSGRGRPALAPRSSRSGSARRASGRASSCASARRSSRPGSPARCGER